MLPRKCSDTLMQVVQLAHLQQQSAGIRDLGNT